VDQRRVGVQESAEFFAAAAEQRQNAWRVVTSVGAGHEEGLNAGLQPFGIADVAADGVIERCAGIPGAPRLGSEP
jgi:hypothetical protein